MEEPPFINLAPPDPVSGRCNVDRGVPCKVVRKPTVAITAETENPEWVSNFFHKKHTTHRSVLPTMKIQIWQFYLKFTLDLKIFQFGLLLFSYLLLVRCVKFQLLVKIKLVTLRQIVIEWIGSFGLPQWYTPCVMKWGYKLLLT